MSNKKVQPIIFVGGVFRDADPRVIPDDKLVEAGNSYPNKSGMLETRPQLRPLARINYNSVDNVPSNGTFFIGVPDLATQAKLFSTLLVVDGSGVITDNVELIAYDSISGIPVPTVSNPLGVNSSDGRLIPNFINYKGETLVCGGYPQEGFYALRFFHNAVNWVKGTFAYAASGTVQAQTQDIPICPSVAAVYRGRVVWANFGPGKEASLLFADSAALTTTATDADYRPFAAIVGSDALSPLGFEYSVPQLRADSIVAMQEVMLGAVSAPVQSVLLVLGKRHAAIASGEPLFTTDTPPASGSMAGDLTFHGVQIQAGCFGQPSVVTTPYGTFWAGPDNVWYMQNGQAMPVGCGIAIRPELRAVSPNFARHVQMFYKDDILFLGLPSQEEMEWLTTDSSGDTVSAGMVPKLEFWWADLRQGVEQIRWFGPMKYGPFNQLGDINSDGGLFWCAKVLETNQLIGVASEIRNGQSEPVPKNDYATSAIADVVPAGSGGLVKDIVLSSLIDDPLNWSASSQVAAGDVVRPTLPDGKWFSAEMEGLTGTTEPGWQLNNATSDGAVSWLPVDAPAFGDAPDVLIDVVTKQFQLGDPSTRKTLRRMDLSAFASEPAKLTCKVYPDGNLSETVMETSLAYGGNDANVLGVGMLNDLRPGEVYSERMMRPSSSDLITGHSMTFRFQDSAGYVIDASNDTVCLTYALSGIMDLFGTNEDMRFSGYYETTIPHGVYDTLADLQTAVLVAINAAIVLLQVDFAAGTENQFAGGAATFATSGGLIELVIASSAYTVQPGMNAFAGGPIILTGAVPTFYPSCANTQIQLLSPMVPQPTTKMARCAALFSLLGFKTGLKLSDVPFAAFVQPFVTPYTPPAIEALVPYTVNPWNTFAEVAIPSTHAVNVKLESATATFQQLAGKPYNSRDR